jgi:hypothetical protein
MNRNGPCPCGSGRRYKHCCGAFARDATGSAGAHDESVVHDPRVTLNDALRAQKAGRLAAAEDLYGRALQQRPGEFDALHMLGVVKFQLGKFEDAARLLVAASSRVPESVVADLKHNLALCLIGVARERGVLGRLTQPPQPLVPRAPFVRRNAGSEPPAGERERISIIVTDVASAPALARTLDGIGQEPGYEIEVIAVACRAGAVAEAAREALARWGPTARLIVADDPTLAGQITAAAAAGDGELYCFLRAGDRWAPRWPARMAVAMRQAGTRWGFSGLRIVAGDGTLVRHGAAPDADALLRAQDELYQHQTASLAFLSFNPLAGGRNLIVERSLWQSLGGLTAGAADPMLAWAWRTAQRYEPLYLDDPAYLIPAGTAGIHLHEARAELMVATTGAARSGIDAGSPSGVENPYLRHGVACLQARQWQLICSLGGFRLPLESLQSCAAMLDIGPTPIAPPSLAA